jgi:hypothetical protein
MSWRARRGPDRQSAPSASTAGLPSSCCDLAIEWFDQLVTPVKQRVTYRDAAHSVAFEQADEVQKLLVQTVVPATYGT